MDESVTSLITPQQSNLSVRKSGKLSARKTSNLSSSSSVSRFPRKSLATFSYDDSSIRNSTGKLLGSPNKSQEVIPHYLRASTGSCHDFCKYGGRKHTFEEKPWRVQSKKSKPPSDQLILGKTPVLPERKKAVIVKPASSRDTKEHFQELKPSHDTKPHLQELKHSPDTTIVSQDPPEIKHSPDTTIVSLDPPEIKHSPDTTIVLQDPPEIIKREVSLPAKKVEVSPTQESASRKQQKESASGMTIPKTKIPTKLSPLVEPKARIMKTSSPSSDTSEGKTGKGRKTSNIKDGKTMVELETKASVKKVVVKPLDASSSSRLSITGTMNLRKNRNLQLVSSLKDQSKLRRATSLKLKNEKVPEKTLHVVKTEPVNGLVTSLENPPKQSRKAVSHPHSSLSPHEKDHLEEEDEEDEEEEIELVNNEASKLTTKKNEGGTLKKSRSVGSKDKDSSAQKLKFRRGKVVELQAENNTPRKLRFRRGGLLVGNQDGKADVKRTLKKKVVAEDKDHTSPIKVDAKVVLRHQDVQNKKDPRVLLNNVIKETASKLAVSKKSKVKALVGAFETVISLQEKPSSQAAN